MKFIGTPGQLVRITKLNPINKRQIPKSIRFDKDGYFETENKHLIKRLSAKFKIVEEVKEVLLEKNNESEVSEEELRNLAKEAGIKSWHVKSVERIIKELEELEV